MTRTATLIVTSVFSIVLCGVFLLKIDSIPLILNGLKELTGYFFGVNVDFSFLISIAGVPIIAALSLPKEKAVYKISDVCLAVLAMFISVFAFFILSLIVLTFFGDSNNPLMPEKILIQPFPFYMVLFSIIGLVSGSFLISKIFKNKHNRNTGKIDDIGSYSL